GWDAIDKQIRSWSFYSGGGFGEAVWTRDGNKWSIRTTARTAGGKRASATNVVTRTDDDHMTRQMTRLTVDGQSLPDPRPLKTKPLNGGGQDGDSLPARTTRRAIPGDPTRRTHTE